MSGPLLFPETPPLEIVLRAVAIYIFLLAAFRLMGSREFGQMTPFDLILLLIISESVSNALSAGDNTLGAAMISAATLLIINVAISHGKYRSKTFRKIVTSSSKKLIENGVPIHDTMKRETMTLDDLLEALREEGVEHLDEVKAAYLESDGKISVIKRRKKSESPNGDDNDLF
jgi:uncharacterized membrane protein YcaP (DUF421 family)